MDTNMCDFEFNKYYTFEKSNFSGIWPKFQTKYFPLGFDNHKGGCQRTECVCGMLK